MMNKMLDERMQTALEEISEYIFFTNAGSHYKMYDDSVKLETIEVIDQFGLNAFNFSLANCVKYIKRFGLKSGYNRDDLLKIIHYSLFALVFFDKESEKFHEDHFCGDCDCEEEENVGDCDCEEEENEHFCNEEENEFFRDEEKKANEKERLAIDNDFALVYNESMNDSSVLTMNESNETITIKNRDYLK
jgi:hypothetical protein